MSLQVAAHQTEGYQVDTDLYAGPLDLLLGLIERAELDITRLALAQVTDQYLEYMRALQDRNPAEVSAFLVIAARLVQIKSSALLPRSPSIEQASDEPDLGEALARQLILYRRFKQISAWLEAREHAGLRTYLRLSIPVTRPEAKLDLSGITLNDLVLAGREIFFHKSLLPALSDVVNMPRVTIREKIRSIVDMLRKGGPTSFQHILLSGSRLEIVVTFIAVLELIKRQVVEVHQENLFAEIMLQPIGEWQDNDEEPLDFNE